MNHDLQIYQHRSRLSCTRSALAEGNLTLGFTGGSITEARVDWNWPEAVCAWFLEAFPGLRLRVENIALGATGSDLAVFRARRDLVERGCDLVFVEFAVNDDGTPPERRMRAREGLLRQLLEGEGRDVLLVYTFHQPMYADMIAGRVPASIADFERLGQHYNIGSIWAGLYALREVQRGSMRWEEWLPDGLHPQFRGSLSYAQSVIGFLERELSLSGTQHGMSSLPVPLDVAHWGNTRILPFDKVCWNGPWQVRRSARQAAMDEILFTPAVGACLEFDFEGTALMLGFDFGKASAEFRFRVDDDDWQVSERDRPDWCGNDGWYRIFCVAENLKPGRHHFELEVVHANPNADPTLAGRVTGTNFALALIGSIA